MRLRQALVPIALTAAVAALVGGLRAAPRKAMTPFLSVGPRAVPARIAGPGYGLFSCQLGLSSATCYDPYQMRTAYGTDQLIAAGFDGHGKTIVIVDAFSDPALVTDLNYFDGFYGLPGLNGLGSPDDPTLGTFTQVTPDGLGPPNEGWAGEITLDVEWAHAIAPGANITLVLAKSNDDADILSATKYAVDNRLGDVISQSFGENESCMDSTLLAEQHEVFAEATLKNITLFASAGDSGAAQGTCDGSSFVLAASSPASDPLVTAVGGTELHAAGYCLTVLGCDPTTNPAPGTYQGEVVWNEVDTGFGGTGGGFSVLYGEPPLQQGTIPGGKQRGAPDVSYNAAVLHGVLTRFLGGWYLLGGTSAGSPQWAAITAITDQMAGRSVGLINRSIYDIGQAKSHYSASLFDVTSGNNSFAADLDNNGTVDVTVEGFNAGPGWDPTTGLGSPNMTGLANYLILFNSPGDGAAAVATTKPHPSGQANANGHMNPHASR